MQLWNVLISTLNMTCPQGVLEGQPELAVQHEWLRVSDSAQVSHDSGGVHASRRSLEFAE